MKRSFPENPVGVVRVPDQNMVYLSLYSTHLKCLFPQDGRGMKHERRIRVEPWQVRLVETAPWGLLRGCIRSDGCVFLNATGPYRYLTYDFCNRSEDIARLFASTCSMVGLDHRVTCWRGMWRVRINRRSSVNRMLEEVGTKE
jgi:hypothetical protein